VLLGTCLGPIGNFKWRIQCWEHVEEPLGTSSGRSNVGNMLRTHWELVEDPCWQHVEDPILGTCGGSMLATC